MIKQKHILFVTNYFFPHSKGGTEHYIHNLSKGLISNNYKITILIPKQKDVPYKYVFDDIEVESVLTDLSEKINGITLFAYKVLEIRPDIIHFHTLGAHFTAKHIKVAKSLGFRIIFTPHLMNNFCIRDGSLLYLGKTNCNGYVSIIRCQKCYFDKIKYNYPIFKALFLRFLLVIYKLRLTKLFSKYYFISSIKRKDIKIIKENVKKVIAISAFIHKINLINKFDSVIIEQGTDLKSEHLSLNYPNDDILHILFIGRFSEEKRIGLLIDAINSIESVKIELKIITFFDDNNNYFKEYYAKNELNKKIIWLFNLNRLDISLNISQSNIVCIPSNVREMAPLAIIEAHACKRPVLVSSLQKDHIMEEINGFSFENNNINDLISKLESMAKNIAKLELMSSKIGKTRSYQDVVLEHINVYN